MLDKLRKELCISASGGIKKVKQQPEVEEEKPKEKQKQMNFPVISLEGSNLPPVTVAQSPEIKP